MRNFLQGKWLGHPLHPLLVHLPIGLFVLALVFDGLSYFADWPHLVPAAFYAIGLGIVTAVVASIPGLADFTDIRRDSEARSTARIHMLLNFAALFLYGASALLRYPHLEAGQTPLLAFLLSLLAIATLSYSGYIGGSLVYDDGVAVGRHRRAEALPDETVIRKAEPGTFVEVGSAAALAEGQSLRVEVNSTVAVIVNREGTFYALQEFCTHRYGPLSEGRVVDGQIECPWHRSCFDLRTGKATDGPAKVDLKTFPIRVRDGKIEIQI
jgi:nitrite reductase/ring-hydroxylating ferredoxin subunit/uncharacterized membrane protein